MTTTFLSGAAFGAAMMAASFHNPAIVIAQMKFENWHMMQAFLAATASSAAMYAVADRLDYVKLKPRSSSPLALFSKYDGNIIGGALLGTGMALSGSCPGTLYAQLAAGVHTGFHALNGAILGGLLWTGLLSKVVKQRKEKAKADPITVTANDQLGLSRGVTLLLFEAVCLSVLAVTTFYTPKFPGAKMVGTAGGFLIGLSQLFSLATRRSMIGISTVYEEVGNYFWCIEEYCRRMSSTTLALVMRWASVTWQPLEQPSAGSLIRRTLVVGDVIPGSLLCRHLDFNLHFV